MNTIKVLTLNTHSWVEIHQVHKIKLLADFILDQDIDLIALQEVNQNLISPTVPAPEGFLALEDRPLRDNNFALLLTALLRQAGAHYQWTWAGAHLGWNIYDEGSSILSKQPIQAGQHFQVSSQEYGYRDVFRRCALACQIKLASGPLWLVNVHMNWWHKQNRYFFAEDFNRLNQRVRQLADRGPLLLLGDFNVAAGPDSPGWQQMLELGWHDAFWHARRRQGEHTVQQAISGWEENSLAKRIDYVLASGPVTFSNYRVVFDGQQEPAISDHAGVLVELEASQLSHAYTKTPCLAHNCPSGTDQKGQL